MPPGWATNPPADVFAGPYDPPPPASAPPPAPPNVPQASAAAYGMYDQHTGVFVDPAGGTGVYAPGVTDMRPQENWVDLMLYPEMT